MKPNFALNILPDGLELLHRATPGWERVGRVDLDAEDLPAELAALRRMGEAFGPEPLRCKLVIPNEQIRYMSIYTGPATEAERRAAVLANLDGATPYPLDQLQFCWSVSGNMTHLAAVAEETLAEAEAFAMEHGFNPVSFVAIPEGGGYIGEPYFGPTTAATTLLDGETVERDAVQIHVIGNAALPPEALPGPLPAPEEAQSPVPDTGTTPQEQAPETPVPASPTSESPKTDAPEEDAPSGAPAASEETPPAETGKTEPASEADATPEEAPAPGAPAKPEQLSAPPAPLAGPRQPRDLFDFDAVARGDTSESEAETPPSAPDAARQEDLPIQGFQSVRKPDPDSGAVAEALQASLDSLQPPSEDEAPRRRPSARRDAPATASTPDTKGDDSQRKATGKDAAAGQPGTSGATPAEKTPEKTADKIPAPKAVRGPSPDDKGTGKDTSAASDAAPQSVAPLGGAPVSAPPKPAVIPPAPPARQSGSAPDPAQQRASEAEQLTVFGERPGQAGDRPRRGLGRAAIAALVLAGIGVAGWAALNGGALLPDRGGDAEISDLLSDDTAPQVAALPEQAPATTPPVDSIPDDSPASEPSEPEVAPPEISAPETPAENTQPPAEEASSPPRVPMQVRPAPATPAEAAARYAATGIWQRAPAAPLPPLTTELGEISLAALTPAERAAPVVGLEDTTRRRPSSAFQSPVNPPAPDLEFELDERGLVAATPDGALTPEGHMAYLGAPEVTPPARPEATLRPGFGTGTAPEPAPEGATDGTAEAPAAAEAASPPAAPEEAEPPVDPVIAAALALAIANDPEAELAPGEELTLAAPGSIRPRLRPEGIAPEDAPLPEEADLSEGVASRPRARPEDFAVLVAAAQAAAARAPQVAIPSPTVTPPGPSQPSVARLATVANAIDLNRVNLIGVMGEPSSREALVRLADGRTRKVAIGDRLDGGRVAAIGDNELRYVKNNRSVLLRLPD